MLAPDDVHHGRARRILEQRERILRPAWSRHPERFVHGIPEPEALSGQSGSTLLPIRPTAGADQSSPLSKVRKRPGPGTMDPSRMAILSGLPESTPSFLPSDAGVQGAPHLADGTTSGSGGPLAGPAPAMGALSLRPSTPRAGASASPPYAPSVLHLLSSLFISVALHQYPGCPVSQ